MGIQKTALSLVVATMLYSTSLYAQNVELNLPAQSLQQSVQQLARQANVDIIYVGDILNNKTAPKVQGNLSVQQALQQLLQDTNLRIEKQGDTWSILQQDQSVSQTSQQPDSDLVQLPVITVNAIGAITEGTGSYTADWMRTANGLALPQKQTPQSTSVITRQLIEDRGLQNVKDVMQNATGVTVTQAETDRFSFQSRGFEIDNYQYDGVPTTIDSTYQYGDGTLDTAVYDHIEIVRGATGLMQNTGQPGASINFIRKRPTDTFQGYVLGQVGTPATYRTELDVGGPLNANGSVRGRFVGAVHSEEGTMDLYKQERGIAYGIVEADVTDATTLTFGAKYQRTRPEGTTWAGLPAFDSNGDLIDWKKGATVGAKWTAFDTDVLEIFSSAEHTFDNDWKAHLSVSHLYNEFDAQLLYIRGNPDPITGAGTSGGATRYTGDRTQNSVSGSLNGDFNLFDRPHQFVTGFSAARTTGEISAFGNNNGRYSIDNIFDYDGNFPEPVWASDPADITESESKELGIYGATRLSIADPLHVTIGARVNWWEANSESFSNKTDYKHSAIFVPYAGVTYDLTDLLTLYGSYTKIFKPQPYMDETSTYLDPAEGHNYEVGVKGSFFDEQVNASFAVFQTNQDNAPEFVIWDSTLGRSIYRSIDGTTTRGFEIEVAGEVYDDLNLFAGYTHRNSEDNEGNAFSTDQPRTTIKVGATYNLPGAWDKLTIGGTVRWQSKTHNVAYYLDEGQSIEQGNYAIFDAMARYQFNDKTSLNFNIYNIADEKFYRTMGFYNSVHYGEGRSAQASLKYKF